MQTSTPTSGGEPAVNPFDAIAARMESLAAPMSDNDGVRSFNDLYLAVTRAAGVEFANHGFEDRAFLSRLAPTFSNLYFDAVEADAAKRTVSPVWAPLFERRLMSGIAPLRFAIAGMNAHINHDLAIALVAVTKELGYDLDLDSPHHRDHLRVNTTLARVRGEVAERFGTGFVLRVDRVFGSLAGLFASWSIERARDNAWTQAQTLMALEDTPFLREQYLLAVARTVGFASRALLLRTGVIRRGAIAVAQACVGRGSWRSPGRNWIARP
jgi:hypothetical protein